MCCSESPSLTTCWSSAQLSRLSPGRLWATGLARQRESKGEGKLHAWFCRQNEPPGSARASQKVSVPGFTSAGLGHTAQINPWALRCLPAAPAAVGVSSCESQGLFWLQTRENLFQRQGRIPQAQLLKDGCSKAADFSAHSFFLFFL